MTDVSRILEGMVRDLRAENAAQHEAIMCELRSLDHRVGALREWKAKAAGIAAAVSAMISAAAWAVQVMR
jgi:hypothetical protein